MTEHEVPADLLDDIGRLGDILISEEDVESTVTKIAELAVQTIDGCDFAGVSLVKGKEIQTLGATDPIVEEIDKIQYDTGEGPCLSSIERQATFKIEDFQKDKKWPKFSKGAAGRGAGSMLSFVLQVSDESLAGLNLYSKSLDAFSEEDIQIGLLLASHAAVALANAQTHQKDREKVEQLEKSVETRTVIGQAVGILMAQHNFTSDQAFDVLRRISQRINVKVREVAQQFVSRSEREAAGGD